MTQNQLENLRQAVKKIKIGGSMPDFKSVPKKALYFIEESPFKFFVENKGTEEETVEFEMVAYSGGIIPKHPYWGDLAIDVKGIKFNQEKYPILMDHKTDKKVGYANKEAISSDGSIKINSKGFTFVSTKEAEEFRKLSKEGFPYQASIYAIPSKLRRLDENETVEVNGLQLSGPNATIWEECTFKEASICTFGADSNTKSMAFANDDDFINLNIVEEEVTNVPDKLTLESLKKDNPELVDAIKLEAKAEVENQFTEQIAPLRTELDELKKQNAEFAKREVIRKEKDMKLEADRIWENMFSDSGLPERLFAKIRGTVSYSNFIADDALDVDKFKDAITVELKDWAEMGVTDKVIGGGKTAKELDAAKTKQEKFAKENDDAASNLLKLAGVVEAK